ncbi:hypothetical protein G3N57_08655 [Paraburkholderia sp. Se-20369]|nr:hypothetical protein [Paraburkholderia sp. Se-20369]
MESHKTVSPISEVNPSSRFHDENVDANLVNKSRGKRSPINETERLKEEADAANAKLDERPLSQKVLWDPIKQFVYDLPFGPGIGKGEFFVSPKLEPSTFNVFSPSNSVSRPPSEPLFRTPELVNGKIGYPLSPTRPPKLPKIDPDQVSTADNRATWENDVKSFGISGDGIEKSGGKRATLARHGETALQNPEVSPIGALSDAKPGDLVRKVAAPNAGDHSPSISLVNDTKSDAVRVRGRGAPSGSVFTVDQKDVPTLQFTTSKFTTSAGEHATTTDSAAHSVFTSLREMHGAGEPSKPKASQHNDIDSVLDATANSYSPYNSLGEPNRRGVELPKVNIHAESKTGDSLHRSGQGVDPLVGQQMINSWYRQNAAGEPQLVELLKNRQNIANKRVWDIVDRINDIDGPNPTNVNDAYVKAYREVQATTQNWSGSASSRPPRP